MDYEVCRKTWESQVAVQFTLQSGGALGDPLPYYTMLPRFSYLALALPKVLSYFERREDGEKIDADKVWLEANSQPLKMYVPIGVIYDQMNPDTDAIFEITVRTSEPPAGFVPVDRNAMQAMFTQSIKEADYLKTKAKTTQGMQPNEFAQLWRSVTDNIFEEFFTVLQKLMESKENSDFEFIPLRVYNKNGPFKQILISSKDESGSLRTIGDAVSQVLGASESEAVTERRLVSHGIDLPVDTPLIFAAKNLTYPDTFVHIVAV